MKLAFVDLNLRRNPFGELSPSERAEIAVVDTGPLVEWVSQPNRVLEYVAECGRGKSSHLWAIAAACGAEYLRIPEERDEPWELPAGEILVIDEAQFLSWWQRRKVFRRGRSYVVGTHEALTKVYRRARLEVKQEVIQGLSVEKLGAIVERRIEASRRGEGPVPVVEVSGLEWLIERRGDDVRGIEGDLYEVFQRLEAPKSLSRRWLENFFQSPVL